MSDPLNPTVTFSLNDRDIFTFEQFRQLSIEEVDRRYTELARSDADMPPFLTVAGPPLFGTIDWSWTEDGFLPDFELLMDHVPDALADLGKQEFLTMAGLAVTTYLHPDQDRAGPVRGGTDRIEAVLLALVSNQGEFYEQVLRATIQRHEGRRPSLGKFEPIEGEVPANIGDPMRRGLELGVPDSAEFTAFVDEALPEYLAYAVGAVGDVWDGSPFLVLAIPERGDLEGHILTGESAADRVREIFAVVRSSDDLPIAGAYVASGQFMTPAGLVPGEATLLMSCADAEGRQAETAKRLHRDETGAWRVSEMPADVETHFMRSTIMQFLVGLMNVSGLDRAGLLPLGEENWQALLNSTLARLEVAG